MLLCALIVLLLLHQQRRHINKKGDKMKIIINLSEQATAGSKYIIADGNKTIHEFCCGILPVMKKQKIKLGVEYTPRKFINAARRVAQGNNYGMEALQVLTKLVKLTALDKSKIDDKYDKLKNRDEHPAGRFDSAGRFYASNANLINVRQPSRAFPFSEMAACRTKKYAKNCFLVFGTVDAA